MIILESQKCVYRKLAYIGNIACTSLTMNMTELALLVFQANCDTFDLEEATLKAAQDCLEYIAAYDINEDELPFSDLLIARKYPGDGEVWKAIVHTSLGKTEVMLKLLDSRRLFIECLCALVGRNLGLPVPHPYLVRVRPGQVEEAPSASGLAFGASLMTVPKLARARRSREDVRLALQEWSLLQGAIAFDELIANTDRNMSNILLAPSHEIHLIDHDQAISPLVTPESIVRNELLAISTEELRAFERRSIELKFKALDIGQYEAAISRATSSGNLAVLSQGCRGDAIHQFLLERTQSVRSMILEKLKDGYHTGENR